MTRGVQRLLLDSVRLVISLPKKNENVKFKHKLIYFGGLVAQAVRRSPPTAGFPSSRLGHSMWVSWWTKRGLGKFSRGFSRFPLPQISFHHFSTLISSIRSISSALVMVRQAWSADTLAIHGPIIYRGFIASHPSTRLCVGHELRIFIYTDIS